MRKAKLSNCALPVCLALAACTSSSTPTSTPASTPSAPSAVVTPTAATPPPMAMPTLAATPADKLGTVAAGLGLSVGTKAPDAMLVDVTGKPQHLAALYAAGPTFVVFYRGGWCPFCNLQLHSLTAAKPDFDAKRLRVIAISVDQPGEEAKTQAKQGVPFPMLSDSTLIAHKAFNVVHVQTEAEAKAMAGFGVDIEKYSGQNHHSYAVPAIFLVDRMGIIRWEHVDNDFKTRPTPAQMLQAAEHVLKSSAGGAQSEVSTRGTR